MGLSESELSSLVESSFTHAFAYVSSKKSTAL